MVAPEFEKVKKALEKQGEQHGFSFDFLNAFFGSLNEDSIVLFAINSNGSEGGLVSRTTLIANNMNYQPGNEK
jgi:hypothetical protein